MLFDNTGTMTKVQKQAVYLASLNENDEVSIPVAIKAIEDKDEKHPFKLFPETFEDEHYNNRALHNFYSREYAIDNSGKYNWRAVTFHYRENSVLGDKMKIIVNLRPETYPSHSKLFAEYQENRYHTMKGIMDRVSKKQNTINMTEQERQKLRREEFEERKNGNNNTKQ